MKKILDEYESGAWGMVMHNTPYNRSKLTRFKRNTGADYTTYVLEGDLYVIFKERTAAKLINE